MLVIITYDVNTQNSAGKKRLRNVAKVCVNYGQRVQNSVFECVMDQAKCREVKHKLTGLIDKEHDSLRFYYLGKSFNRFLIISLDVLICRYSPLLRAFPALFISEEPHKSFYYPSCFHSQK